MTTLLLCPRCGRQWAPGRLDACVCGAPLDAADAAADPRAIAEARSNAHLRGAFMCIGAVVVFFGGLSVDRLFYGAPLFFLFGVLAFVRAPPAPPSPPPTTTPTTRGADATDAELAAASDAELDRLAAGEDPDRVLRSRQR